MSDIPSDLRYTAEHEYLKATDESDVFQVGITDYAQGELGDVVYLELPGAGDSFQGMDTFGTIEAVKAVSDLYCPLAGEVIEVNDALESDPALVNSDPYGEGWMIKLRVADPEEVDVLMDAAAYAEHIGE
ncbi:MAG: glycine cleavage system protein GcvH [Gemmatimonadota bacterium]|nr:glycine cleavage system protein GcvH [Gemmatimonadota bacterium]